MADEHQRVCEVISERLYISGADGAADVEQLRQHSIQRVINLSGREDSFPDEFEYLNIRTPDNHNQVPPFSNTWLFPPLTLCLQDIASIFDQANSFLDGHDQPAACLVHCNQGVSRAASVVIAFLISKEQRTLCDAFEHLRCCRSVI